MESHSKTETRKGTAPKEKRAALAESEEDIEPLSPIQIGSEAPLPSEFEFPDALELKKMGSDTQNRLKAILEVAGVTGLSQIDARTFQDPEILRKLTNSVSSALDEAATALTRMKSDRQTYEAFLRGANQAPSPSPLHPTAPHVQHHPSSSCAGAQQHATTTGEKVSGNVTLNSSRTPHPLPQQQPHPQQQGVPHPPPQTHQQQPVDGGHGRSQQHHHHAHHHSQPQQQQQSTSVSATPPSHPSDSMQTVQRLLTQGHSIQEASEDGESLLSLACSAGYYELAEVLLRMRASVEDRGIKGDSTPLMEAASGGYADIVKLLIDHGANVNAKSSVGNTALTYACCGGYEDVVKILLDAGADVEHQNENGHTPLMEAASCGHVGVAKLLLQYGANINTHSNEFKESALTLACYKGHLEMVKFLLGAGADQEHKTDEMHTALMEASMDGHVDVARLLLDHGAQVNMPVDSFESPLTLAACGGHYELAALLISRGADLEEVNDEGYTPLMEAAREGHEDVVQLLVEHGANVNAQTEETQETALTLACCGGFKEVVQYLIEHGADIELGASTPLMEASQEGHVDIVKFLLERGAKVHAETSTGDTALTYACANGHTLIADILLQCGAELEHESEGGRTPLMKAARAGHLQTIQFLVAKGADVNRSTTNNDHTVLSLASAGGHVSVVQYLLIRGAEPSYCLRDGSTMLIEAARGGHTNVVNLLLRQPLMKRRQQIDQSNENRKLAMSARKHANSAPSVNSTSSVAPVADGDQGKPLTSTLQHLGPEQTLPQSQVLSNPPDHAQQVSLTGLTGSASSNPGSVQLQHPGKSKAVLKSTKNQSLPPQQHRLVREGDDLQQQQVTEAAEKIVAASRKINPGSTGPVGVVEGQDVIGAKRPKMSGGDPSLSAVNQSTVMATPTKPSLVDSDVSYLGTPPHSSASSTFSPGHYTTDSATALKNMQRLTSNANSPLKSGTIPHSDAGSSVDVPPLMHTQTHVDGGNLAPPSSAQSTHDYIVQGHMQAADDIIARYWRQQNVSEAEGSPMTPMTPGCSVAEGKPNGAKETVSDGSGQRVFPSDSLDQTGGGVYHAPRFHASSSAMGMPPGDSRSLLVNSSTAGDSSTITQAPGVDAHPLSNMDLTRLIPHLEALAGSLQNPSSFESQYLSALAAHSQLVHHPLSSEDNTVDLPPDIGDEKILPSTIGSLDPSSLLSAAEIAKLLPNIANFESHSDSSDFPAVPTGAQSQPIYPSNLSTLRHLSQKLQGHTPSSDMRPDPGGGATLDEEEEGEEEEEEEGSELDVDLLQHNPVRSLPSSLLLDSKFPLDIPPPNDLMPAENLLPSGYDGSLENESYPTSDEEEEPDEDESDSSYLAPDISNLMPGFEPAIDIDQQTDSNHDTALTLAAAGGHDELVELLLNHGANIEHKDKKGCTPLILAASAGHAVTVAILLDHNADIEAQSDRTKDTALSLACSGGRQEVVELLLAKGANFEHRNVSDYTPLSLAASGGYVNIIKLLLRAGADINSRTGSKLGISPLMLAAMNGHTSTVKLLLDMGSDINAQIETNRNTALTLACFQGRHEVVNLLVERQANVEHRAKTGLTPLMEAASGGYYEVGKVLINKGADVNAAPVPSSKDTALTIAADKGHYKFVELILRYGASVDVKNKKGNSPLWLAANGGHLDVIRLLVEHGADVDSQDNRKVSCLMAAFRRGHFKVVKYLVDHVSQFPSDSELTRYIGTLSDKELLKKSQRCMEVIIDAKERQAAEANKNATILLQEIDLEKKHEEDRRAAAARKREKKKRKKEKKKAQKEAESDKGNGVAGGDTPPEYEPDGGGGEDHSPSCIDDGDDDVIETVEPIPKIPEPPDRQDSKSSSSSGGKKQDHPNVKRRDSNRSIKAIEVRDENHPPSNNRTNSVSNDSQSRNVRDGEKNEVPTTRSVKKSRSRAGSERASANMSSKQMSGSQLDAAVPSSSPRKGKREEGWKEVGRRTKKLSIPSAVFAQVIGKNGSNLAAIRQATSTQIDVDRHSKQSPNRTITVRGSADAIKQVHQLILLLINDPNQDINQLLPKYVGTSSVSASSSSHKRHVSSSHDPTPSILPLETFEVASDALPARGNPTATSASAAAAPTGSTGTSSSRVNYRKAVPISSMSSSVGGSGGGALITSVSSGVGFGSGNRPAPGVAPPSAKGGQSLSAVYSTSTSENTRIPSTSLPDAHRASEPSGIHSAAPVSRLPSIGSIQLSSSSTVKAASSGAVRRLFTSAPQPSPQQLSTSIASSQSNFSSAPTLPKPSSTGGAGGGTIVRTVSGHSVSVGKSVLPQSSSRQQPPPSGKVQLRPHETVVVGISTAKSTQQQPTQVSAHSVAATITEKHQPHVKTSVGGAMSMSYSRVINAAPVTAIGQDTSSVQPHPLGGGVEVIEQPLQQIMKTPTIFQDPATQLTKAKKKSTYSDAVGKKSGGSGNLGGVGVAISGPASSLVAIPPMVSSSVATSGGSGGSTGGGVLVLQAPPSSQSISTAQQNPSKIINRAPGSRPLGDKPPQLAPVGVTVIDKRSRPMPWNEIAGQDKPHPHSSSFDEEGESIPQAALHSANLGPIGPPSRSIKTSQSGGFVSGPGSAGKQNVPTSGSITGGRSFSPAGPRPKTSPTALNTSPHRNENSPAAKSPLLGTAPSGLLPPPDKGSGVYNTGFRPIQQHPEGESSGNIPTLVPTPVRNSRPPLLETPPGFRYVPQGMRQKPSSPVPSPEKSSPNKSPPIQAIKGFNPNAPTFVPMAMQNQRPANPPTSSILGAPPAPKFPVFGPVGGGNASILGSAPQLPAPGPLYGGGNQQPRMMSPGPPFSNQPPPPPPPQMNVVPSAFIQPPPQHQPPQPPQQQPPPITQSSILGHPPAAPMNPHVYGGSSAPPPTFQTIQSRPPGPPGQGGPGAHPPQSAGMIQQQSQGSSQFGLNLVPFAQSVEPSPIGASSSQPRPLPTNNTGNAGVAGEKFGLPMFFKSLSTGGGGGSSADGAGGVPSDSAQTSLMFATTGAGSVAGGVQHFDNMSGGGVSAPPPPTPPAGVIAPRTAGTETIFNHLNLGHLGAVGGAMGGATEGVPDEASQSSPSFQQPSNGFSPYPYLQGQPSQELLPPTSSIMSVGGGVVFTPSSNFIVMTPGVFTTANAAGFTSSVQVSSTPPDTGVETGESLLPIGTERAHKSTTLPAAFSMLAPGNVWSYSGNPSSDGSDWAKVSSDVSDWPSSVAPPSSAGNGDSSGQKLESVLERLGFSEYLPLFQKNEIDLDALQLMSEKEFSEIGLPTSPTHKLLSALQQNSQGLSSPESAQPPTGKANSRGSTPLSEPPVISASSKQHAASQ